MKTLLGCREEVAALWHDIPEAARAGVLLIVTGTAADALAHMTHPDTSGGFTVFQTAAHLVILLGMVVTLLGVVIAGYTRNSKSATVSTLKEVSRASRRR